MPALTIVASNRDRLDLNTSASQWFIKSIQWQNFLDMELLIADGGSANYEEIDHYFKTCNSKIPMRIIQHKIGEPFERALLNNVGIRNANSENIMCTDCDILFGKDLMSEVMENMNNNIFIESRTMYWKSKFVQRIYSGELDPYTNLEKCKVGRIHKRSTGGGLEAAHKDVWNKVRGFNEQDMHGWGSEDAELLERIKMAGIRIKWLGESLESIKVFHQPHPKKDIKNDLEWQEKNKVFLNNIKGYRANLNNGGWGGKLD